MMIRSDIRDQCLKYYCKTCNKYYSISREDLALINEFQFTFGGDSIKSFINKAVNDETITFSDVIFVSHCPKCEILSLDFEQSGWPHANFKMLSRDILELPDIDYNSESYRELINITSDTLKGVTDNKKGDADMVDIVTNDNKSVSIFTKLNGVDIDLSKLKKIIYIDEFTGIKTEYDITKIELTYDGVIIHVDAGEKHRSVKISYDRYNDTDYSMLELVTQDTLSFVRRV